ncbi:MAG: hypothetical protein ACYSW7_08970 [Planctomycetota bacterium]|jgi:hypothetical protein
MTSEHEREIIQLWWVANHYLGLADAIMIRDKELLDKGNATRMKVEELADKCQSIPYIENNAINRALMEINAHLGSCAVRLNTIDEILGKSYISSRWYFYQGLVEKKDKLQTYDITDNLNIIIHFLMRHNVAHREDPPGNQAYKTMRDTFNQLKIEELLNNMHCVKKDIKADIEKHGIQI